MSYDQSRIKDQFFHISQGAENKMYTLRLHTIQYETEGTSSFSDYFCNLSTNFETATEKATSVASSYGIRFVEFPETSLFPIERKTQEELDSEKRKYEEKSKDIQRRLEIQRFENEEYAEAALSFFFGKHENHTPDEVYHTDPLYVEWVMDQDYSEPFSRQQFFLMKCQCIWASQYRSRKISKHIGSVGDKLEFEALCILSTGFESNFGYNPSWVSRYVVQDEDGNRYLIDYTGNAWDMVSGYRYQIKGTIKDHTEYDGVLQTVLTRVKSKDL